MRQNITCNKGRCWEEADGNEPDFDELFNEDNIVKKIEKDLWSKNIFG